MDHAARQQDIILPNVNDLEHSHVTVLRLSHVRKLTNISEMKLFCTDQSAHNRSFSSANSWPSIIFLTHSFNPVLVVCITTYLHTHIIDISSETIPQIPCNYTIDHKGSTKPGVWNTCLDAIEVPWLRGLYSRNLATLETWSTCSDLGNCVSYWEAGSRNYDIRWL